MGNIIIPETFAFMAYNTQCGEIVAIGSKAKEYFPEAKVGMTLLIHHFCQSENEQEARIDHLIHQDETHNYYCVTAYEWNGKTAEAYGVWDGEKIIPNKDYIFLESEKEPENDLPPDEAINQGLTRSESGLFLFNKWEETREQQEAKQKELKAEVSALSRSGINKEHVQKAILHKEKEMENISVNINRREYKPFKVVFYNKEWLIEHASKETIEETERAWVLNFAAQTKIKFQNKEYRVAKVRYVGLIH